MAATHRFHRPPPLRGRPDGCADSGIRTVGKKIVMAVTGLIGHRLRDRPHGRQPPDLRAGAEKVNALRPLPDYAVGLRSCWRRVRARAPRRRGPARDRRAASSRGAAARRGPSGTRTREPQVVDAARRARCASGGVLLLVFIVLPHPALHARRSPATPGVRRTVDPYNNLRLRLRSAGGPWLFYVVAMVCARAAPLSRRVGVGAHARRASAVERPLRRTRRGRRWP